MSAENKALVERWFDQVWSNGRADAIDEMFAAEGVAHGLGQDLHGPAEFKVFHATFRGAFPDVRVQMDELIAEGDRVAYRFTATGTHRGGDLGSRRPAGRSASSAWGASASSTAVLSKAGTFSINSAC